MAQLSNKENLQALLVQRDSLEAEADAITSELTSPGPNGESPAGLKGTLDIDSDGFPRSDIDLYNVKRKRQRLAVINTDYKILMKSIEKLMELIYSEPESSPLTIPEVLPDNNIITSSSYITPKSSEEVVSIFRQPSLSPFAKIDEIAEGSPAHEAGLENGDLLLSFGPVNSTSVDCFNVVPSIVRSNIEKPIAVIVQRNEVNIEVIVTPKTWSGRGVLGCHLTPILS